jgi:hypothetical protein
MSKPVAIITGGASGIGLALTKHLLTKGYHVVMADVNTKAGTQLSAELGPNTLFHRTDVSSYAEQVELFKSAISWGGTGWTFSRPTPASMIGRICFRVRRTWTRTEIRTAEPEDNGGRPRCCDPERVAVQALCSEEC